MVSGFEDLLMTELMPEGAGVILVILVIVECNGRICNTNGSSGFPSSGDRLTDSTVGL
jgi:hypothetical protein